MKFTGSAQCNPIQSQDAWRLLLMAEAANVDMERSFMAEKEVRGKAAHAPWV